MQNPRLGRFFSRDPLEADYPHYTPYQFSGNKVVHAIELEGLEEWEVNTGLGGEYSTGVVNGPYKNQEAAQSAADDASGEISFPDDTGDFKQSPRYVKTALTFQKDLTSQGIPTARMTMSLENGGKTYQALAVINRQTNEGTVFSEQDYPDMSTGESLIPVWGSGKAAIQGFQDGRILEGSLETVMAITDIIPLRSIVSGGTKASLKGFTALKNSKRLAFKFPKGKTFEQFKKARGGTKTLGFIETTNKAGKPVLQKVSVEYHHAIITQRTQRALNLPNWLVNNRINVWRLNTIQHSIIDPHRFKFLRYGLKPEVGLFKKYNLMTRFPLKE